jgi:plasmid stability protein
MPQLTVRNIPPEIVKALRIRAAKNGRSAESEHRLILAQVLQNEAEGFWARADARRAQSPKQRSNSGDLQREMREER